VHQLAQKVLQQIRRGVLLSAGERVGVAVSGGSDSVALLRILCELRGEIGMVLAVIHFNHQLRGPESDADEEFVAQLADKHKLDLFRESADVSAHARTRHMSVEAAARELRHDFFRSLMRTPAGAASPNLDKVATGHTADDQAETVLMRVMRGAGTRGLAGIHVRLAIEDEDGVASGEVVRPFLGVRRCEIEQYLRELGQLWREDSTNLQTQFTRNRIRHLLLPLVEREFNPAIVSGLAELAEIAREEEDYWENEAAGWMGTGIHWTEPDWSARAGSQAEHGLVELKPFHPGLARRLEEPGPLAMNASVDLAWFLSEPVAVQRRIAKVVGATAGVPLEFRHVEEIREFAAQECVSGKRLALPMGWKVIREPDALVFLTPDLRTEERVSTDYEYPLSLPGRARVPEAGIVVEAVRVAPGSDLERYNRDRLLEPSLLARELTVRNWRPGDRFWPAHTKSPRKVKELLQERHLTGIERKLWPVAVSGEDIVWLRGFPGPARLAPKGAEGILIMEAPLE
jgi:tRNA(Ile)-lysidine synthase